MTDGPLVSVVIPSFNRSAKLADAIESVRLQTHTNIEILVVDDGSTDNSYEIANRLTAVEPRLRVVRHDANVGAQAARNTGIQRASGDWVAFLDSDDTYLPFSVERRLETALRAGTAAVHGDCLALRPGGIVETFGVPSMKGDIRSAILANPGPAFPALLVRRECFDAIGDPDESIVAYQEWDTAIRLAFVTRFGFVPEPTFVWDQRGSDTISRDLQRSVVGYEQVVRKHLQSILRYGGPRVLASHLREAADQRRAAGHPSKAMARYALSLFVWPLGFMSLGRKLVRRLSSGSRVSV